MKTVRRLLYHDITASVLFVALAFLSLFFFIDLVDELDGVGRRGRTTWDAFLAALLEMPGHFYDLLPVAVLIGSIYALTRMAQSSEYTILRTGGLGPGRALGLLAVLGAFFGTVTFVTGDFIAPASERQALLMKARFNGAIQLAGAGAWLKERRSTPEGERSYSVHVAGARGNGALVGVRVFEFDADGRLVSRTQAEEGQVDSDGSWTLSQAEITTWPRPAALPEGSEPQLGLQRLARYRWPSTLSASVVAAAVLPLGSMTTLELWRYSSHLNDQEQASQEHKIRFWRKALYPLACLVMMALALPFAYLNARSGSVSLRVFGGILLGISFVLLNNLTGFLGQLQGLSPWVAAAAPSGLYLLLSMAAFAWLVRYR
jgi:lipopolysaccharide export system permease protein